MNDAALQGFRDIASAMQTEPTDWKWIGVHMSQCMFGITEKRAKDYVEKHGGKAEKMSLQTRTINGKTYEYMG